MLRYFIPANWFFVFMMMAITCYIAYNFNMQKPEAKASILAPVTLIQYIIAK